MKTHDTIRKTIWLPIWLYERLEEARKAERRSFTAELILRLEREETARK